jgi:adenylate kinase family enzyme
MQHVHYLLGASGTGKSTRADELSAKLGPRVRIFSTDVIRA